MHEVLERLTRPLIKAFSGEVSLAYHSFETGEIYTYNATQTMRAASLIKLPLLIQALTEVARGNLELGQHIPLKAEDQVGGAGILHTLKPGLEPTLHDLLTLMIIVSDNTATNLVIDLLGLDAANRFIQNLGLAQTKLAGQLQLPEEKQTAAQRRGERNTSCAADIVGLLLRLENRDLLPDKLTTLALNILRKQQFTEALARYLPIDRELHNPHVVVASKSGCLRRLWHDAGLVYSAEGSPLYSLVVMTEGSADRSYSWEQEGMMLIAELSREIYDHFVKTR